MIITDITVFNNIKLDFLHIEEKSDNNGNVFSTSKYIPQLNNDSKFLVTFDDGTTTSHGITANAVGYTFSIYKEASNTNELTYVARINEGELTIDDYNINNNTTYKYYVFKEGSTGISEVVTTNDVTTCWNDWSIVDVVSSQYEDNLYFVDTNNIWKFNLNLTSSDITQNVNNTIYNNLTHFPKISMGNLNYSSGSITCLLGDMRNDESNKYIYYEPIELSKKWNAFCTNGNLKLLKDRKGNTMLVAITGTSSKIDDLTSDQIRTVTFNWTQVDDSSNIRVIRGTDSYIYEDDGEGPKG